MKRIFPTLLFILLFSLMTIAQSAKVIKENANLRGTAAATGKVVTVLPNGAEVEVIKQFGAWFLVQSKDYVGWLHGNTIQYDAGTIVTAPEPFNRVPDRVEVVEVPGVAPATVEQPKPATTSEPLAVSLQATALCVDGTMSYLDRSMACKDRGGVYKWIADPAPATPSGTTNETPSGSSPGGIVQVKGYYRKDGTYVRPHTRSAPRRN